MRHSLRVVALGCFLSSTAACKFDMFGSGPWHWGEGSSREHSSSSSGYVPDAGSSYRPPTPQCSSGEQLCTEGAPYIQGCMNGMWAPMMCQEFPSRRGPVGGVCHAGACAPPDLSEPCSSLRIHGTSLVEVAAHYGGPATYEAWAKLDPKGADGAAADGGADAGDDGGADAGADGGAEEAIVFGQGGTDAGDEGWLVSCASGALVVDVFAATGPEHLRADAMCDDGLFHHVAVTFGAGTHVFFDGALVAQTPSLPAVRALPFNLGGSPTRRVAGTTTLDEVFASGSVRFTADFDPKTVGTPTTGWFGLFFDEGKGTSTRVVGLGSAPSAVVDESMWSATCR